MTQEAVLSDDRAAFLNWVRICAGKASHGCVLLNPALIFLLREIEEFMDDYCN